jgi:hypothetical protein
MEYLKKLNDAELKYLNQFMAEYVSGAFKKTEEGDYSSDNMHKTIEERRECYSRNNSRNRCGLTISNATGQTLRCDDINELIDSTTYVDLINSNSNEFSDFLFDEYGMCYEDLTAQIQHEMYEDYCRCINPKDSSDRKLAESNYGKSLLLKFKNFKF